MEVDSDYNKNIATMRSKEFPALAGNLKYNFNLIYNYIHVDQFLFCI